MFIHKCMTHISMYIYCRWTKYSNPFYPTPNIAFANMCAETLRFGGGGVQHSVCAAGFEYSVHLLYGSRMRYCTTFVECTSRSRSTYLIASRHSTHWIILGQLASHSARFKITCRRSRKKFAEISSQGLEIEPPCRSCRILRG